MGFLKPVPDSDDEDGDIYEQESFPSVFNTFANKWCVKKIKMYLSLHFGSMLFPKFPKCSKLNVANCSILVKPRNSKIAKNTHTHTHREIKMPRTLLALK